MAVVVVVVGAHGCCLRRRWRCEGRRGLRGRRSSIGSSREKLTLQVHVLSVEQLELLLDLSEERVQLAAYLVGEGAAVWLQRRGVRSIAACHGVEVFRQLMDDARQRGRRRRRGSGKRGRCSTVRRLS